MKGQSKTYSNGVVKVSKESIQNFGGKLNITANENFREGLLTVYRNALSMVKSIKEVLGLDVCDKCGK